MAWIGPQALDKLTWLGAPSVMVDTEHVCGGLSADLDYVCNQWRAPHFNAWACCLHCSAKRDESHLNVRDVSAAAGWRATARNLRDRSVPDHPVWRLPGVSSHSYTGDYMHTVDLGVSLYLHASALQEMAAADGPLGLVGPFASRVDQLWARLKAKYDACGETKRIGNLTAKMLGGSGATFAQVSCKANESKHMLRPMLELCRSCLDGSEHAQRRVDAYTALVEISDLVSDEREHFLSPADSHRFWKLAHELAEHYMWLTDSSINSGTLQYNPVFKVHWLLHISFYSRFLHPRLTWAYMFEDFMGRIKGIATSAVFGTAPHNVPKKVASQYMVALSVAVAKCE